MPANTPEQPPVALPPRSFQNRFCGLPGLLALLVFALDQLTKWLVCSQCEIGWGHDIIPGFFTLVHVRNKGAAWGIFSEHTWLLGLLSLVCFVLLAVFFDRLTHRRTFAAIQLGLLAGGIIGNMVDRLFRHSVVDFLDFHWQDVYHYPAFNVADSAICVSMFLLVIWSFREERRSHGGSRS